jgi:hypothetical protein
MKLSDYFKERNIPSDSLEANSIMEGYLFALKMFGGIPNVFKVGGQPIVVKFVERCDNNALGCCRMPKGCIEIADKYDRDEKVSEGCKLNTFYHELTYAILYTMGENDLNNNEKFVCTFSSLLTEALTTAKRF